MIYIPWRTEDMANLADVLKITHKVNSRDGDRRDIFKIKPKCPPVEVLSGGPQSARKNKSTELLAMHSCESLAMTHRKNRQSDDSLRLEDLPMAPQINHLNVNMPVTNRLYLGFWHGYVHVSSGFHENQPSEMDPSSNISPSATGLLDLLRSPVM